MSIELTRVNRAKGVNIPNQNTVLLTRTVLLQKKQFCYIGNICYKKEYFRPFQSTLEPIGSIESIGSIVNRIKRVNKINRVDRIKRVNKSNTHL